MKSEQLIGKVRRGDGPPSAPIAVRLAPHARPGKRAQIAALDLGSNSFHLVLAWIEHGTPHVYDRRRERVALGTNLHDGQPLDRDARARALLCLQRFGELLRPLPPECVRIVGTDALRRASDGADLVRRAEQLTGHSVEIAPGYEEARLVWRGVSAMRPPTPNERRLVVDIGGGSTEVMTGEGWALADAHSTPMGCIRFTERFYPDGRLKKSRYVRSRDAAMLELRPFAPRMRSRPVELALGASGTMRSIGEILATNGWSSAPSEITRDGVDALAARMLEHRRIDELSIDGLSDDRRPVLAGGLAIIDAVMRTFGLSRLEVADGALREGLLMDIVGRLGDVDVRDDTVAALAERHGADPRHASAVRRTAESLFDQVAKDWKIDAGENRRLLGWAAQVHELGLSVSHTGVARHGAYLIANADAPGFSRDELGVLAAIVRTHRGHLQRSLYDEVRRDTRRTTRRLAALLRIAVALHADRRPLRARPTAQIEGRSLVLTLPARWLRGDGLLETALRGHIAELSRVGVEMTLEAGEISSSVASPT